MLTKSSIHTIPSEARNYKHITDSSHHFNLFGKPAYRQMKDIALVKWKFIYGVIQLQVTLAFLAAGIAPWLSDIPVYLFSFQSGIPVSFLYAVSIITMLLALIQLVPVTSFAAQLGLLLISIAVVAVHLIVGSSLQLILPAIVLMLLVMGTISLNYKLASPDTSRYTAFE